MNKQTYETPRMTEYGDVRTTTQATSGQFDDNPISVQGQDSLGTNTPPNASEK